MAEPGSTLRIVIAEDDYLLREGTARLLSYVAGIEGLAYLLKERIGDVEEVVRALRETAAGGSVIDPRIVEALIVRRARGEGSRLGELSPRELEVLREMARGKTNVAIAQALVLSVSAVEKYVGAIFDKLGLAEEPALHRRVAPLLASLRSTDPDADSAGQGG